jgi:hypothetical protein
MSIFLKKSRILVAFVLVVFIASCGYSFIALRSEIPQDIRTVYIPYFENMSSEPDIGFILASEVTREFIKSGVLIPTNRDRADAEMLGVVKSISISDRIYDKEDEVILIRAKVNVDVQLKRIGGDVIWEASDLAMSEDFVVGLEGAVMDINEKEALVLLASKLAKEIHDGVFFGF